MMVLFYGYEALIPNNLPQNKLRSLIHILLNISLARIDTDEILFEQMI